MGDKDAAYKTYLTAVEGKSNNEARAVAADILGGSVFWDCDRESCGSMTEVYSMGIISYTHTRGLLPLHWWY